MKLSSDIIELIRQGDKKAINSVYSTYFKYVLKFVKKNGGEYDQACDVFQESIISLYSRLKSNPDMTIDNFDAYFTVLYKNRWYTLFNTLKKENQLLAKVKNEVIEAEDDSRYELYLRELSKLKTDCQRVIKYYLEGLRVEQIAVKLNTTKDYAKRKKYLCKEKLKQMIREKMSTA